MPGSTTSPYLASYEEEAICFARMVSWLEWVTGCPRSRFAIYFFLEDLSYRSLTVPADTRNLSWISELGCRGFLRERARAPDPCSRSAIMQRFCSRLSGSTGPVVREHDLALAARSCPGARFRLSGSTVRVVREHDSRCLGARFRFVGTSNAFCAIITCS